MDKPPHETVFLEWIRVSTVRLRSNATSMQMPLCRYAVDSLILLLQSITAGQAALEFNPKFTRGMTIAVYIGMLAGALFWGLGADIFGRRIAFNLSLFICSTF